jgi:hypothetical protein
MLIVKQTHVYRPAASVRWFLGTVLLVMALLPLYGIVDALHVLHGPIANAFPSERLRDSLHFSLLQFAIYLVGYGCAFVVFLKTFWSTSLALGPGGIVLREKGSTLRIGPDDILGRKRSLDQNEKPVDVVVSRSFPRVSIRIPDYLPVDEFFRLWLHSLPDLDRTAPVGPGSPAQGVSDASTTPATRKGPG